MNSEVFDAIIYIPIALLSFVASSIPSIIVNVAFTVAALRSLEVLDIHWTHKHLQLFA